MSAGLAKCFELRVKSGAAGGRHDVEELTIQYVQWTVCVQMCSLCKVSARKTKKHPYAVTTTLLSACKRFIMSTQHSLTAAPVVSEAPVGYKLERS